MASRTKTSCNNPACRCEPCVCTECRCGRPHLGELERRVMEVLWRNGTSALTARDVSNALTGYAYTTIATVLDRLARKGEVLREREGQVHRYAPTRDDADHTALALRAALDESSDPAAALARLVPLLGRDERAGLRSAL